LSTDPRGERLFIWRVRRERERSLFKEKGLSLLSGDEKK
jgi:hypothetical protein